MPIAYRLKLRDKILAGYFIPVVFLFMLAGVVYQGLARNVETIRWVVHTYEVIDAAREVLGLQVDMETRERGFVITGQEAFLDAFRGAQGRFEEIVARIKNLVSDNPPQVRKIETIAALHRRWADEVAAPSIAARRRGEAGTKEAIALVSTAAGQALMDEVRQVSGDFIAVEQHLLEQRRQSEASANSTLQITGAVGTLLAIIAAIGAGLFLSTRLTRGIGEAVSSLGSSSSEILSATAEQAASSAETATAVSQASTTVEQARQTMQLAVDKARAVLDSSRKAVEISLTGKKAAEQSIATMDRGREQMASVAQSILMLSERSQSIGEIIAAVSDLTDQSNLLAVNAAIEAAKAGEQGRGFGVVATEIRSLAEQAKQATTQVRTILGEIQKATNAAVMAAGIGATAVEGAGKMSRDAGDAIRLLSEHTTQSAHAASQIAASSQEQSAGMDQIAQAMRSIQQATAQNVAGAKQAEGAARDLAELGSQLQALVGLNHDQLGHRGNGHRR